MINNANLNKSIRQSFFGGLASIFFPYARTSIQGGNKKKLLVLCYHNIVKNSHNARNCDDFYFLNLPQDIFVKQIRWVVANFDVINLDDLISGASLPERSALFTFDDGFKSVYTHGFPILKKHKIPATLFLNGAHFNEGKVTWISRLHYTLDRGEFKKRNIRFKNNTYCLSIRPEKIRLLKKIKSHLKEKKIEEIWETLFELENMLKITFPSKMIAQNFLSELEVEELCKHGWTIGNHTYNHVNLNFQGPEAVRREILDTRQALKSFKQYRDVLAIPFGERGSFSDETIDIAHQSGIRHLFTTQGGLNNLGNNKIMIDRIVSETFSFSYFKFLAKGQKRIIDNLITK